MAKAKEEAATQPTDQELYEQMMEFLTPEQRAQLMQQTGQANQQGGTKTPTIRVNFNGKADNNGKKIERGNFVLGQVVKLEGDGPKPKKILVEAGTDLGERLEATLLKVGTQYSFYAKNPKDRCASQILLEKGETPIGHNLQKCCSDGSCPRRQEGLEKDDKCSNQYVAFFKMPEGTEMPDGTPVPVAMMYFKGINYMPFKDYLKDGLGDLPSIMTTTILTTEDQDTYFDIIPEKGSMVTPDVFKANFELVNGVTKSLLEHKAQQQDKMQKALPAPPTGGGAGKASRDDKAFQSAKDVSGGAPAGDDDITW